VAGTLLSPIPVPAAGNVSPSAPVALVSFRQSDGVHINGWSAPKGSLQTTVPFCFPLQAPSLAIDENGEVVAAFP
jgi:hypothetical protein